MQNPLGQGLRELPGPLLLTGHTGFKGTWMTFLLEHLNVPVVGYSLPAEKDSLYDRAERTGAIPETFEDIREYVTLEKFIDEKRPSTIIHMAAQPLVLKSYENPRETFDVNVMGTVNLLDIAFKKDYVKAILIVTTDKVYRNDNSGRAFVETDPLEGKDPYSSSKVGTESVVAAWQQISRISGGPKVLSVRAGNVIGGGDYAENRIIPDLIRGVIKRYPVEIRNPHSTRPWQYVLDVLHGYLLAIEGLLSGKNISSLNFGPEKANFEVQRIAEKAIEFFPDLTCEYNLEPQIMGTEAKSLSLESEDARSLLNWRPQLQSEIAIEETFNWWKQVIEDSKNVEEITKFQVKKYFELYLKESEL